MKNSRTQNAKLNIIAGTINKVISLGLPFILRTAMIQVLGAEYLGLSSLFTSILTVLSLTELGFSSAVVYSMYKPIADGDGDTICALMALYRKVYRIVGVVVLVIGLSLMPFLHLLINGSYPDAINLYMVYGLYLCNSVMSYFLFAYKNVLLQAHQQVSVTSNVHSVVSIVITVLQITLLFLLQNYYIYLLLIIATTLLNNVVCAYHATKRYPQYICKGKVSPLILADIKRQVSGLMIQKVCGVTRNSFDSIYISMFLGLEVTTIYSNYYMIMSAIRAIFGIITTSITAGIGNSVASESVEKNYNDYIKFDFIYMFLASWASVCLLCLYQPFMLLWMGSEYLLEFHVVALLVVYFYGLCIGNVRYAYSSAAGLWWQSRGRAIAETIANIFLNYFLGKYFGLIGIVGATLISLLTINFLYGSQIIFKYYFKNNKITDYFLKNLLYACVTAVTIIATYTVCQYITMGGVFGIAVRLVICGLIPPIIYFIAYYKNETARRSMKWFVKILKR